VSFNKINLIILDQVVVSVNIYFENINLLLRNKTLRNYMLLGHLDSYQIRLPGDTEFRNVPFTLQLNFSLPTEPTHSEKAHARGKKSKLVESSLSVHDAIKKACTYRYCTQIQANQIHIPSSRVSKVTNTHVIHRRNLANITKPYEFMSTSIFRIG
jgi:hypothetical protein